MNFGEAIKVLKEGHKVTCKDWNKQWLMYVPVSEISYRGIGVIETEPWIAVGISGGEVLPYIPSQKDMLAEDWQVVK